MARTSALANTTAIPRGYQDWDDAGEAVSRKLSAGEWFSLVLGRLPKLKCDGTAATRAVATLNAACALGTDPRSFLPIFANPSAKPAALTLMWWWGGSASAPGANSFAQYLDTGGEIVWRIFGASTSDYRQYKTTADVWTLAGGTGGVLALAIGMDSAGFEPRLDGTLLAAAETTAGTPPADWQASLTSTYFAIEGALNSALVAFWPANYKVTAADVMESLRLGGGVPDWRQWGSQVIKPAVNPGFESGDFTNWSVQASGTTVITVVSSDAHSGAYSAQFVPSSIGSSCQIWNTSLPYILGKYYRVRVWAKADVPGSLFALRGVTSSSGVVFALATDWAEYVAEGVFTGFSGQPYVSLTGTQAGTRTIWSDDFAVTRVGALFLLAPGVSGDGLGCQLHAVDDPTTTSHCDLTIPIAGWSWSHPARRGYVRATPTWSGTHESKSLLGQRAWPNGCVVERITLAPSAGSSGTGATAGDASTPNRFAASAVITTAKKVLAIAEPTPAGTSDAQNNPTIDPDSANYTGSIQTQYDFVQTEG